MEPIAAITVYCSSSRHVPTVYFDAARDLGRAIAGAGWRLVYGGNRIGCMGALADAAREAGGSVTGITPQLLVDEGMADEMCEELIVTPDMRQRKALLEARGDAFIALPGGMGTFEELFEIVVAKLLGCHQKPIVLLNIAGYYSPLVAMIEHGIEHGFIRPKAREAYRVVKDVAGAIELLRRQGPAAAVAEAPADGSATE